MVFDTLNGNNLVASASIKTFYDITEDILYLNNWNTTFIVLCRTFD